MDERRKLMMMHKALYLRDDIDRLYVSRKEGARGIEDSVNTLIRWLEDYIKRNQERVITVTRNNTKIKKTTIRKQKWEEKQLDRHFK